MNPTHFFAMMSRMKYIERWALMRNSVKENISEHSLEVAMLGHGLAVLAKVRFHREDVIPERVALMALYHDCTEIITGDMPTPIKYDNADIQEAYKQIEMMASYRLLNMLPGDMREYYEELFVGKEEDADMWHLVKAADRLSALIKCIEEEKAGNREFASAKETIEASIYNMQCPEAELFMEEFLPAYYKNLDELSR